MPQRPHDHQKSVTYRDDPGEQQLAETICCLVLRSGGPETVVTTEERQRLYERYRGGYGLVVLAQADGRVVLRVEPKSSHGELARMIDDIVAGDGVIPADRIPERFRDRKGRPDA
jgi:hypothetical protein